MGTSSLSFWCSFSICWLVLALSKCWVKIELFSGIISGSSMGGGGGFGILIFNVGVVFAGGGGAFFNFFFFSSCSKNALMGSFSRIITFVEVLSFALVFWILGASSITFGCGSTTFSSPFLSILCSVFFLQMSRCIFKVLSDRNSSEQNSHLKSERSSKAFFKYFCKSNSSNSAFCFTLPAHFILWIFNDFSVTNSVPQKAHLCSTSGSLSLSLSSLSGSASLSVKCRWRSSKSAVGATSDFCCCSSLSWSLSGSLFWSSKSVILSIRLLAKDTTDSSIDFCSFITDSLLLSSSL